MRLTADKQGGRLAWSTWRWVTQRSQHKLVLSLIQIQRDRETITGL